MAVLGLCFCARSFSSCGNWGHSSSRCTGLSLSRPLLLRSTGSRRAGAQQLWLMGLVAPRHVGSSQTRARTRVSCIGRQILIHCATREALFQHLLLTRLSLLHCITFACLSEIGCVYLCGSISGLSVLLHGSLCLFFYPYHTVLHTIAF